MPFPILEFSFIEYRSREVGCSVPVDLPVLEVALVDYQMPCVGDEVLPPVSVQLGLLAVALDHGLSIALDPEPVPVGGVGGGVPFSQVLVLPHCY